MSSYFGNFSFKNDSDARFKDYENLFEVSSKALEDIIKHIENTFKLANEEAT